MEASVQQRIGLEKLNPEILLSGRKTKKFVRSKVNLEKPIPFRFDMDSEPAEEKKTKENKLEFKFPGASGFDWGFTSTENSQESIQSDSIPSQRQESEDDNYKENINVANAIISKQNLNIINDAQKTFESSIIIPSLSSSQEDMSARIDQLSNDLKSLNIDNKIDQLSKFILNIDEKID
eukprot:243571_1